MVHYNFNLPMELVLEILSFAALPDEGQPLYRNTLPLLTLSHGIRRALMPQFLHTVILNDQNSLNLFIRSVRQQRQHPPYLRTNYATHIRRFWSSELRPPIVQDCSFETDYSDLGDIFSNVECLGFNLDSLHLLYAVLQSVPSSIVQTWKPKRLMLKANRGMELTWNPLRNSPNGPLFLQTVTHLSIWKTSSILDGESSPSGGVPSWVHSVPFNVFPRLQYFAFPLVEERESINPFCLAYAIPSESLNGWGLGAQILRGWTRDRDPRRFGKVFRFKRPWGVMVPGEWEARFLDEFWSKTIVQ